jgi:hypothetical protein
VRDWLNRIFSHRLVRADDVWKATLDHSLEARDSVEDAYRADLRQHESGPLDRRLLVSGLPTVQRAVDGSALGAAYSVALPIEIPLRI